MWPVIEKNAKGPRRKRKKRSEKTYNPRRKKKIDKKKLILTKNDEIIDKKIFRFLFHQTRKLSNFSFRRLKKKKKEYHFFDLIPLKK